MASPNEWVIQVAYKYVPNFRCTCQIVIAHEGLKVRTTDFFGYLAQTVDAKLPKPGHLDRIESMLQF